MTDQHERPDDERKDDQCNPGRDERRRAPVPGTTTGPGSRSSGGLSISGGEAGSIVVSAGDEDMLDCSGDRFYGLAEIRPGYEDAIIQQKSCLEIQIPREYSFIRTRHLDRG